MAGSDDKPEQSSNGTLQDDSENHDAEAQTSSKHVGFRSRAAAIVENFSFMWFTLSMNTGILSILMHQLPYQVMRRRVR
jgi:hypothetical protein